VATNIATLGEFWGKRLFDRRVELGLSQHQVAEVADLAQQSIARFESGQQIPLDRTKVELARALGTTPTELFTWPPMEQLVA
jgi:transcriptional regulator with XRE-family HTH domain